MQADELMAFLGAIDDHLAGSAAEGQSLELYLLGRAALVLGYGLRLMTKDVDVVYAHGSELMDSALAEFGEGSAAHATHTFYLEAVSSGLPPLPAGYQRRCTEIGAGWRVIRLFSPEVHDLASSKLSRFHARDREDLKILCDSGGLTAEGLRAAVDSAFQFSADEDEDPRRKAAYSNLERVARYIDGATKDL